MSASRTGLTVGTLEMEKRTRTLTEKALANKIETIQKKREKEINRIKGQTQSLKELMRDDENAKQVKSQLDVLMQSFENATALHTSLMPLIPPDEQEKQNAWFTSINTYNQGFIEDVKVWFTNPSKHPSKPLSELPHDMEWPQETLPGKEENGAHKESIPGQHDVQNEILPCDSISNHSSRKHTSKSNVSTTSSARLRAEAEMAALLARQTLLNEKHALEEQEEQIRKRKEHLQFEADIVASAAKVNVLRAAGSGVWSAASRRSNGMESYFEKQAKTVEVLNTDTETFIPHATERTGKGEPAIGNADSHFGATRPRIRQKEAVHTVHLHQEAPELIRQSTFPITTAHPLSYHRDVHTPSFMNSSNNPNQLLSLMEKQNEITAMLVHQQRLSSLPKRDIQTFDGDPLQYHTFMRTFEQIIEGRTDDAEDCLHFLEQYTRGQPKELVRSCQHTTDGTGYAKAKTLLHEHFGNEFMIASAYLDKVSSWQSIMSEDGKALQAYGLFLRGCCNAMEEVHSLSELNTPATMLTVIKRLPYKLRDKWRTVACDIQERHRRRAMLVDIVGFIERQVKIVTDPVFGNIQDVPKSLTNKDKEHNRAKHSSLARAKGSSFATTVSAVERKTISENTVIDGHSSGRTCLYCKGGHMLESCALLEKRAHREKIDFLKTNGVCFGCLCTGHISKDCRKRLSCETCGLRHPSTLHIHPEERGACSDEGKSNFEYTVDSSLVAVQTSGLTGAGEQNCKLAIVPVKIKSMKDQRTVETYVFLDQGSSASFCTMGLMDKLNLSGRKTKILLRTMGQEKIVDSCIVSDLEVAGLDSGSYCKMPNIFTQHRMPVSRSNIPRQQHLLKWPHLKQIYLPEIDADVELLIGMNVPRALEPLKVIRSVDKGPYAIKTRLGWTVNGSLGGECCDGAASHPVVTINRISAVTLDELWKQQFKGDFPEFSQEMSMPNSRRTAEQHGLNLKRRLIRDASFHKDYTAFMNDLISAEYAERVPASDLERSDQLCMQPCNQDLPSSGVG